MQRSADHSLEVAVHEARHASYATHRGLEVLAVRVSAWEGCTDVRLPVAVYGVQQAWEASPPLALHHIHSTVGALIAPVASEGKLFRGPTDDSQQLRSYAQAWTRLRPSRATGQHPPAWLDLLADVRSEVRTWATAPGAITAIHTLAYWLAREGEVDAAGWTWLWRQPWCAPLHQPPPAPPVAAPGRPQPASSRKKTGLDIQVAWYQDDLERLQGAMAYARQNPRAPRQRIQFAC